MIYYIVHSIEPCAHLFNIQMIIENPDPQGQQLTLPNWIPGSYLIRDFARHVVTLTANVPVKKIENHVWQCEKTEGPLTIDYIVYAFDFSVRGAYLDDERAFFNGSALFLMAKGQEKAPCKIKLMPPHCEGAKQWRVATTLQRSESTLLWEYGEYQAASYEELIDNPVEIGHFELLPFVVEEVPHTIILSGKQEGDLKRVVEDVQKIVETHAQLFQTPLPFKQYYFLLSLSKDGYGGLEHCQGSVLQAPRDHLPLMSESNESPEYIKLLGLFSHEYFHAWMVKRIKPASFMPCDLNQKAYTAQLWAFEGITSYYDDLALVRSGVITVDQYLTLLSQAMTKLLKNEGRKKQTLVESSFDAWIKFYQPNENANNALVSYYLKGSLAALGFDLALRYQNNHRISLDDVMRALWQEYGILSKGVPEGAIEALLQQMGGEKLSELVYQALHTTQDLPFNDLLAPFGLTLTLQESIEGSRLERALGFTFSKQAERLIVSYVSEGSEAQKGGLFVFDEVIAVNGTRVDPASFDKVTKKLRESELSIQLFRQDLLKEIQVTLLPPPQDCVKIMRKENLTEKEREALSRWLHVNVLP